jgi:hypothetical protein
MDAIIKAWRTSRKLYLPLFDTYTADQLNKVPDGFSNNLIWNIGHIIVAQQSLVYKSTNQPLYITDELFELYKPGTRPTRTITEEEINELRSLLLSLIDKTEADIAAKKFVSFNERTTVTGFHLASLADALEFNNYHEGIHLGVMKSIGKFIR